MPIRPTRAVPPRIPPARSRRSRALALLSAAPALLLAVQAAPSCASESAEGSAGATPAVRADEVVEHAFAPGYAGSDACARCHAVEYARWEASLHSRMEQPATPDSVIGRFTEEGEVLPLEGEGRRLAMFREGDRYFVEAPDEEGRQRRYAVDRTVGNRYKQRYLTRFPDGSWHPLPAQWNEADQRFVEWGPFPGAPAEKKASHTWTQEGWQWQLKCAGCHTTGLSLGYDPAARTYDTRWRELAIGCEACHGPGADHARAGGGTDNILSPGDLTHARQLDLCGRCHSRGKADSALGVPADLPGPLSYPHAMRPGDVLDEHFHSETVERDPGDFQGDGASRNHHQQLTDYRLSSMLHEGRSDSPTCTTCHDPHAAAELVAPVEDNTLCLSCHDDLEPPEELAAHTGHGSDPLANPGARCVECHMPRIVNHAGSQRLRSHTFWAPDPARAAATGTPDACLLCHTDRDEDWAAAAAAELWPHRGR